MEDKIIFVSVEFCDDPNVIGIKYWYECTFPYIKVDDVVTAPLGRHNRLQNGIVREIRYCTEYDAPFPIYLVKRIVSVVKG